MSKNITYESAGPASIGRISDTIIPSSITNSVSWQSLLIKGLVYLALLGGILYIAKLSYLWWNNHCTTNTTNTTKNDNSSYKGFNIPTITRSDTADSSSLQSVPGSRYTYLEENVY